MLNQGMVWRQKIVNLVDSCDLPLSKPIKTTWAAGYVCVEADFGRKSA